MSGADRKAAAAERLQPEPTDGSEAVRVGLQLPSGRQVRKFAADAPVGALYDFALQHLTDDQAGEEFTLGVHPGGAPLMDREVLIEDAGVAGGMLRLQFSD